MQSPPTQPVPLQPGRISRDILCRIRCDKLSEAVYCPPSTTKSTTNSANTEQLAHHKNRGTIPVQREARNFLQQGLAQTAWLCGALCVMLLLFVNIASANSQPIANVTAAAKASPQVAANTVPAIEQLTDNPLNNAGTGELYAIENGAYQAVPLLQTSAKLEVAGVVSHVVLQQNFLNISDYTIEAVYVFPLPENAAIRELNVRVGQRTIRGMIRERESAEQLYKAASRNGRVAAVVKQQRPNLFTLNIANIGSAETVSVELNYVQTLSITNNRYSLRLPLTLTPRYNNAAVIDAAAITPDQITTTRPGFHTFQLDTLIKTPDELSLLGSDSHSLQYTRSDTGYLVSLAEPALMDRDLELHWEVAASQTPDTTIFTETVGGEKFILGLVRPPALESSGSGTGTETSSETESVTRMETGSAQTNPWLRSLARELVMVIDTSGSMAGQPMETAIEALQSALQGLKQQDYFNIVAFSDRTRSLFQKSLPADNNSLAMAANFIRDIRAEGGTEMMPALRRALKPGTAQKELIRQIVFITDGAVGYEKTVFAELDRKIGQSRLFTVGIGQAPNSYFMKQAAARGRGTYTFFSDTTRVSKAITDLFRKLENPVMKDLSMQWIGEPGELAVPALRDLHAGEPLVFTAKLQPSTRGFKITGNMGNQRWEQRVLLQPLVESAYAQRPATLSAKSISTLWAREKIATLQQVQQEIDQQSRLPDTSPGINRQNHIDTPVPTLPAGQLKIRSQIIKLALAHKIVTPYTSLVAIDELVTRSATEPQVQAAVPNLAPAGTQMLKINLPQGATGIDLLWLLSASCFTLALMLGGLIFRHEYLSFGDQP